MSEVLHRPEVRRLLSDEHFSFDRTLIEAFAWIKSFRPRLGGGDGGAEEGCNRDAGLPWPAAPERHARLDH